ncbi:MAG: SelT/SelW/SelH family protein [Chloroflexi bacterium]|nr:SelT/SelW/SelH family protein [Chloroflexota bacterium]
MAGELLTKFEPQLSEVRIVPSEGGRFEVSLNGELIYSKLATHRHVEPGEIAALVAEKLTTDKTEGNG